MQKIILVSTLFFLLSRVNYAQETGSKHTPEERAQIQTEWMKQTLKLDETQLVQIEPLNLKYAQKMEEVKAVSGKIGKLKKAKSIMDEKDNELKKILNKDQFNVYLEKREELRDKLKEAAQERKNNWTLIPAWKANSLTI